jgi:methylenetetrahydrofolate reductase (NADPH)
MNISIEIVPRDEGSVLAELSTIRQQLPQVNTINIPDLMRFKLRSWCGCALTKSAYPNSIPHIRAVDFDLDAPLPFVEDFEMAGITSVLVVTGDTPKSDLHPVYPNSSIDLIKKIHQEHPDWRIYAAIDPYRQSFQAEYRYAMAKLEAGACGFFTQPFFDLNLMEIYADLLSGLASDCELYWGVSPVITKRSQEYWETVNHAIFPRRFDFSLDWNRQFAREALDFARTRDQNIYYMPIRINLIEYLGGIL